VNAGQHRWKACWRRQRSRSETKVSSPARLRPPINAVATNVRRAGSSRRRSIPGRTLVAPSAAACRYWSCARAAAELRMLRPGPRPGISGRAYLHVRVHLVPRLRGERPARGLSELRQRARQAPHPPGPPARSRPPIDQASCPARMRSGIRPLIRLRRARAESTRVESVWHRPMWADSHRRYIGDIPNPGFLDQCRAARRGCLATVWRRT
jgi:hypothetical protein